MGAGQVSGESRTIIGRQFRIMQNCGRKPDSGFWAIAHNFLHYVTLPPDKTAAQRKEDTGLSGCHCASRLRTARAWRGLSRGTLW